MFNNTIVIILSLLFFVLSIRILVKIFPLYKKDKRYRCFVKFENDDGYKEFDYDTFLNFRSMKFFIVSDKQDKSNTKGYKIFWEENYLRDFE